MKFCKNIFRAFLYFTLADMAADVFSAGAYANEQALPEIKISAVAKLIDWAIEMTVKYSFQALGGLVIIFAAWIASRYLARLVVKKLMQRNIDVTVIKFLSQLVRLVVLAFGLLMMLSSFGVQIAPLIAGLSVAGVGIGLAIQGPLSNYAAGATLIFTKPFKLGDIIEVNGYQGEVNDITLPRTELAGLDGSRIIIPNKHIIGEVIKNFSQHRKLEFNIGVSYDTDISKALSILETIIKNEKRILQEESYKIGIKEFADSAISLQAFVWVPQDQYTDVKFAINSAIVMQFRKNNIVIPFPRRDVHIVENSKT